MWVCTRVQYKSVHNLNYLCTSLSEFESHLNILSVSCRKALGLRIFTKRLCCPLGYVKFGDGSGCKHKDPMKANSHFCYLFGNDLPNDPAERAGKERGPDNCPHPCASTLHAIGMRDFTCDDGDHMGPQVKILSSEHLFLKTHEDALIWRTSSDTLLKQLKPIQLEGESFPSILHGPWGLNTVSMVQAGIVNPRQGFSGQYRIRLRYWAIDSWDTGETAVVKFNGKTIWSRARDDYANCANGFSMAPVTLTAVEDPFCSCSHEGSCSQVGKDCAAKNWNTGKTLKCFYDIDSVTQITPEDEDKKTFTLSIGVEQTQTGVKSFQSITDESFAFSHVRIFWKQTVPNGGCAGGENYQGSNRFCWNEEDFSPGTTCRVGIEGQQKCLWSPQIGDSNSESHYSSKSLQCPDFSVKYGDFCYATLDRANPTEETIFSGNSVNWAKNNGLSREMLAKTSWELAPKDEDVVKNVIAKNLFGARRIAFHNGGVFNTAAGQPGELFSAGNFVKIEQEKGKTYTQWFKPEWVETKWRRGYWSWWSWTVKHEEKIYNNRDVKLTTAPSGYPSQRQVSCDGLPCGGEYYIYSTEVSAKVLIRRPILKYRQPIHL